MTIRMTRIAKKEVQKGDAVVLGDNTHRFHGIDCPKVEHTGTGYLHDEADDRPYDVDGVWYCGRCHRAMGHGGQER